MKCFRCDGLDFDFVRFNLFGFAPVKCTTCTQHFLVKDKVTDLEAVELLGKPDEIEKECIVVNCNYCETKRFIAVDCTNLNMQSCGLCNVAPTPVGDKIPLGEFLNRLN